MKKKILLYIVLSVIVLAAAVFVTMYFKTTKTDYKYVNLTEKNEFSKFNITDFEEFAKSIGFDTVTCDDTNCTAVSEDKKDAITVYIKDDKVNEIYLSVIEDEKIFSADILTKKTNTILNNFYGYSYEKDYIKNQINKLKKMDGYEDEDLGIIDYINADNHMIRLNVEHYQNSFTSRIWVITNETYEEIKAMD